MTLVEQRQPQTRSELTLIAKAKAARIEFLRDRDLYEGSLFEFVKAAWSSIEGSEFKSCFAIENLCDHLECVTTGRIPRFLANLPPRTGKTAITSVCWPAWVWIQTQSSFLSGPRVKFLCASYNSALSLTHSNAMRQLIMSPFYQKYWGDRFTLREDQNSQSNFANSLGGVRRSTSVGGTLLGLGGDCIVIDDPANAETEKVIETDADRKKVASWFQEVRSTRLNDPKQTAIVVIMQRLHQEDLSGVILDSDDEDWVHYCVPMEWDEIRRTSTIVLPQYDYGDEKPEPWTDPRTEEGELMWPERFGPVEVERMKSIMGPYLAAGRLQQAPVPKGGGIIMRDWWRTWDQVEARSYGLEWSPTLKEFPPFELVVGSLDTSYGEKQENDFNALTIWGIWIDRNRNRRAMLMFGWAKRLKLNGIILKPEPGEPTHVFKERQKKEWGLIEWVADTCKRYKVKRLLIEDKTRGRDVANEINRLYARENWGVELINPVKDKVSRAHGVVPLFTDNCVWAPNTKWAEDTIVECANFPKGAHDDRLDTCLTADVGIVTAKGVVKVSEIKCGDLVLTHLGKWRPVTRTTSRLSDHYFRVKAKGMEAITITGEHPALTMQVRCPQFEAKEFAGLSWKPVKELKKRPTYEFSRLGKKVRSQRRVNHDALVVPTFHETTGSSVDLASFWNDGSALFDEKTIVKKRMPRKADRINRFITLDHEAGWAFGLYAAEGCLGKNVHIIWSCDKAALERVQRWILAAFGRLVSIKCGDGCYRLTFPSVVAVPLFAEFGRLAENKIVPQRMISAPLDFIRGFVDGFAHGDGHTRNGRTTLTSTSRSLLWGLRIMLARLGVPSVGGLSKAAGTRTILGHQSVCLTSYRLDYSDRSTGTAVIGGGYIGTHIETFERVDEPVTVYNISVAEDESYVTVGGTVHNCTQFLNWARENEILIRADEMTSALEDQMRPKPKNDSVADHYGVSG